MHQAALRLAGTAALSTIEDIRFIFAIVVTWCAVSLLIIVPYSVGEYDLTAAMVTAEFFSL